MSELRWNWVYYPYLDAPNKQAESALKAGYVKVVDKDEADKVIAEKDAEIAQLQAMVEERNKQVGELKHSLELASNECCSISERAVKNERRLRRALYKACANWARYEGILFADEHEVEKWSKMIRKCLKKAEEYR